MACLSIVEIPGDPGTLVTKYDQLVQRMDDLGPQPPYYIVDACVQTDNGLMLVHLWESEDHFNANWNNGDLERVAAEVGMPPEQDIRVNLHRVHRHHVDP